jgi:mRNA interferase MazF
VKRGDLLTVAVPGDFGKPRPALVIQADAFLRHDSVVVLPLTSTLAQNAPWLRVAVTPNDQNGLKVQSQVMVDKITAVRKERLGAVFGSVGRDTMIEIERGLAAILGFAGSGRSSA